MTCLLIFKDLLLRSWGSIYANVPMDVSSEGLWVLIQFAYGWQIKEEELVLARHVGEAIKILQEATHCFYDPEELLKVPSVSIL